MKYFHASSIRCSNEDNVLTIGLADDEFDPIDFVIINRLQQNENISFQLLINENDIEFDDVIESVKYKFDRLTLSICPQYAEAVDYTHIQIEIQNDDTELKRYLKKMFKDTSVPLTL